jgi:hypothetical protein
MRGRWMGSFFAVRGFGTSLWVDFGRSGSVLYSGGGVSSSGRASRAHNLLNGGSKGVFIDVDDERG